MLVSCRVVSCAVLRVRVRVVVRVRTLLAGRFNACGVERGVVKESQGVGLLVESLVEEVLLEIQRIGEYPEDHAC